MNQKTVARKFLFLSEQAKLRHKKLLGRVDAPLTEIQFDEMESSVHSKCLPVSIPLVVEAESRFILGISVCSMPAKGLLAKISLRKYGRRADERPGAAKSLFQSLHPYIHPKAQITSDENPKYPNWLKPHFPGATHRTTKGRRGCVVGQGELKRGGFDPLFSLNHTAAMIRANVNRMFRRTWCTSKRIDRLHAHLVLYADEHNRRVAVQRARAKA